MNRDPAATPYDELAAKLMSPARSGAYLTKNELLVLARLTDASVRISDRKRMLVDVLRSARGADELRGALERLVAFWSGSVERYEALSRDFPASERLLAPWITNARATVRSLSELAEDLRAESAQNR